MAFPDERQPDYNPDLVFDEDTGTWVTDEDINRLGGGRHRTTLVVACNRQIYFQDVD